MPARFQLVASTPLCPCGYHGEGERCTCTPAQRAAYLGRLGGPVYDRIDIQAMTYSFGFGESTAVLPEEERSEAVSRRVARAREMQRRRLGEGRLNADMTAGEIARFCETDSFNADVAPVLERLFTALGLSVRSYRPILRSDAPSRTWKGQRRSPPHMSPRRPRTGSWTGATPWRGP